MTRRRWILLCASAALIVALVPLGAGVLLIDRHPLVDAPPATGVDDAVRTRALVKRTWTTLKETGGTLRIGEDEVNSAFAFVSRGTHRIRGRARVTETGITVAVSVRLPPTPFGEYLNGWATVTAPTDGLKLRRVALGGLEVPGGIAQPLLRLALDLALGDETGTFAVATILGVRTAGEEAVVTLRRVPDLKQRVDRIKARFKRVRDRMALLGDPALVRRYYARLIEIDQALPPDTAVPFRKFLPPLFRLAGERGGDAVEENRAAVLALAMFLGSQRFESFVGPVHTELTRSYRVQHHPIPLAGRTDLRLHFLVSAGLKVVADSGLSHAVGSSRN